jgi:hypothetical protein
MAHDRSAALTKIRSNIERFGHHVYCICGGSPQPRFAYTIGVSERVGAELIFAGGSWYSNEEVVTLLNEVAEAARNGDRPGATIRTDVAEVRLSTVDDSWGDEFLLGALDYYDRDHMPAWQILPARRFHTVDVPDLSRPFDAAREPVWKCLKDESASTIDVNARVVTNLAALRGEPVTEGLRRRDLDWELFANADPDVPQDAAIVVPLTTLLFHDESLSVFLDVAVGEGLRREPGGAWRPR